MLAMVLRVPGPTATALGVTWVRALYTSLPPPLGIVTDSLAFKLVPAPLAAVARAAGAGFGVSGRATHAVLARLTAGMTTNIALRTAAIDDAIRRGLERGAGQLVLLGSGLDARAWRMPELRGVDVYELDRPSSHAYKKRRIGLRQGATAVHRLVDIDFERQRVPKVLAAAGFDMSRPSIWLWEGVAVYLTRAAADATLDAVSRCSATDSTLIATYTRPNLGLGRRPSLHWRLAARAIGEPVRGETSTESLHARLDRRGFDVVCDEGNEEAIRRYWGPEWLSYAAGWERVIEAVRRGS